MLIHLASQATQSTLSRFEPGDVQPNAIDLRVESIHRMKDNTFVIDEEHKQHRGSESVQIAKDTQNWYLEPGTYEIIMSGIITLGPNEAGFVIPRSTLNRNGLFITSGLYDSGYSGVMAGALHVTMGDAIIKKGTRVAQFLLFKAESMKQYDGDYGVDKEHDNKYGTFYDKEEEKQPPYYFANGHSNWEVKDGVYVEKKEEE